MSVQFSSVQSLSHVWLLQPIESQQPRLPVHHQLTEFTQTHIHQVSDAIQPSHPLSSPSPPALNPSQHQSLFQWVNSSHEVAKVFSFSIIPSKEIPGLISFRMDWLDLLNSLVIANNLFQQHETTLHLVITRWSILKSDWLYSLPPKMEKLYTVRKSKTWSWLWLRLSAPYRKIQAQIEEIKENH